MKLNIQKFSSTNATTHYELSQYIGTDKPTYLVDYNSDMNKIDTAIYGADSQATQNANNIGTMSNLNTTEKSSLVGAINEVNTQVGTNTNNISTNTSNIGTLGTNQGVMANLTTTEKSSLVGAINEVDAENGTQQTAIDKNTTEIDYLNSLFDFDDITHITATSSLSKTGNINLSSVDINIATNNDKSLAKVYGSIQGTMGGTGVGSGTVSFNTSLRPTSQIDIVGGSFINRYVAGTSTGQSMGLISFSIGTDGKVTVNYSGTAGETLRFWFINSLIIVKDFGDSPIPE